MSDTFVPRLALVYGGIYLAIGVMLPFLAVWFAAKGLGPAEIGLVLAAPIVARIVAMPLVTGFADRTGAVRAVLMAAAIATTAAYALVGLAEGFWPILLTVVLASAAFAPVLPLTDAYALQGLAQRQRAYGPVRLWGSAAFVAGSIGAGLLMEHMAPRLLIWVIVAAFSVAALLALALQPLHAAPRVRAATRLSPFVLLRAPGLVAAVAAASLVQASHAVYYAFSALAWQAGGLSGFSIGVLWALGVAAEIALFALSPRLPAVFTPTLLLALGAAGALVRWAAMALDPPLAALPLLQLLHALSFGATHLGAVQFVARAASPGAAASAQGYLSVSIATAMSVATALAGKAFAVYGTSAYALAAVLALGGLALAFVAHRREAIT